MSRDRKKFLNFFHPPFSQIFFLFRFRCRCGKGPVQVRIMAQLSLPGTRSMWSMGVMREGCAACQGCPLKKGSHFRTSALSGMPGKTLPPASWARAFMQVRPSFRAGQVTSGEARTGK